MKEKKIYQQIHIEHNSFSKFKFFILLLFKIFCTNLTLIRETGRLTLDIQSL